MRGSRQFLNSPLDLHENGPHPGARRQEATDDRELLNEVPPPTRPLVRVHWLLLACTLAVLLTVAAIAARLWQQQSRLVAEVEGLGGAVDQRSVRLDWLPRGWNRTPFRQITGVTLDGCAVDSRWCRRLWDQRHLQWLDLDGTEVDSSTLPAIGQLTELRVLGLEATDIRDDGLSHLTGLHQLELLDLTDTHITDQGLADLAGLPNLRCLGVDGTRLTDAGLSHICRLHGLWVLDVSRTAITDAGLQQLASLPALREVYVDQTQVTPRGAARLQAEAPQVDVFFDSEDRAWHMGRALMR